MLKKQKDTYRIKKQNLEQQKKIATWFDNVYSTKGEMYLRPVKAYYIFLELLGVQKGKKILDVACGLGRLLQAANEYNLDLYGIDLSKVAVKKSKQKLPAAHIIQANAEKIPHADGIFDYITCLGSLERMIHLHQVLREIQRVSKKEAKFCFLVRNSFGITWKIKKMLGLINKKGHQGAKGLEEWKKIFVEAGFEIVDILPDQYPIKKRELITKLGKVDYRSVSKAIIPFKYVHEYIFLLKKKDHNV